MRIKNACCDVASDDYITDLGISKHSMLCVFYAFIYLNYFGKLIVLIALMAYIFLFSEI